MVYSEPQLLLTFVFPSKRAVQVWVDWMPFGTVEIELHDYISESISTDEHGLHPLVRLDSHELTIKTLHRESNAEELLHVLDKIMRMTVHSTLRFVDRQGGEDSRSWTVQPPGQRRKQNTRTGSGSTWNWLSITTPF